MGITEFSQPGDYERTILCAEPDTIVKTRQMYTLDCRYFMKLVRYILELNLTCIYSTKILSGIVVIQTQPVGWSDDDDGLNRKWYKFNSRM